MLVLVMVFVMLVLVMVLEMLRLVVLVSVLVPEDQCDNVLWCHIWRHFYRLCVCLILLSRLHKVIKNLSKF